MLTRSNLLQIDTGSISFLGHAEAHASVNLQLLLANRSFEADTFSKSCGNRLRRVLDSTAAPFFLVLFGL